MWLRKFGLQITNSFPKFRQRKWCDKIYYCLFLISSVFWKETFRSRGSRSRVEVEGRGRGSRSTSGQRPRKRKKLSRGASRDSVPRPPSRPSPAPRGTPEGGEPLPTHPCRDPPPESGRRPRGKMPHREKAVAKRRKVVRDARRRDDLDHVDPHCDPSKSAPATWRGSGRGPQVFTSLARETRRGSA